MEILRVEVLDPLKVGRRLAAAVGEGAQVVAMPATASPSAIAKSCRRVGNR